MKQQRAFTLVELSIVLVILGLLVGGVLTGQSLIHAAELRSVSTQYATYVTAVQTFRDKYFAIPGDMNNATRYWGRQNSNSDCVTNSAAAVNAAGACDGNANGQVAWGDNAGGANTVREMHQFWRHLALAGLIEGNYTGMSDNTNSAGVTPGLNSPKSKMGNLGWGVAGGLPTGQVFLINNDYGNYLSLGAAGAGNVPTYPGMKPEDAYNIDKKMDDGRPASGRVMAPYATTGTGCTTASGVTDFTGDYNLLSPGLDCSLLFPNIN